MKRLILCCKRLSWRVVKYPWYYKYCFTFLSIVVIVGAWYLTLYSYGCSRVHHYMRANKSLQAMLQGFAQAQQTAETDAHTFKRAQLELQTYKKAQHEPNEIATASIKLLAGAHVELISSTIEAPVDKGWYMIFSTTMIIQGSIEDICGWLKQLSVASKQYSLSSINCSHVTPTVAKVTVRLSCMKIVE